MSDRCLVDLNPVARPPQEYTHYCADCGARLRIAHSDENLCKHYCEGDGSWIGLLIDRKDFTRPFGLSARSIEAVHDPSDDALSGSICAGSPS